MNKYDSKAIDCAHRALEDEAKIKSNTPRNIVILTHPEQAASVSKGIAGALPSGSVCTGAVWKTPNGNTVSIKRYTDPVPKYTDNFKLLVCNGGRPMTREDGKNIDRWRAGGPSPVPFVAP